MTASGERRFHLRRCLGAGAFGEVYAATMRSHGGLETSVAVKVLRAEVQIDAEALQRLRDEARALARLDHPAIVRVIDVVDLHGQLAMVTELVDGDDLLGCIEGGDRLPPRALWQAVGQVADALDAAWEAPGATAPLRLVHRDVKPQNVRIGRHGQVKLLDFGIAWFADSEREAKTSSDMMLGSLPYMAPERFVMRTHHSASDVFSLGCCLYEGLGHAPFYANAKLLALSRLALDAEAFSAMLVERLGALSISDVERSLLTACLAFDPAARPSARDLSRHCEALSDALSGPSLRLWCADHRWRETDDRRGPLTGQTLAEGPPPLAAWDEDSATDASGRIVEPGWLQAEPATLPPEAGETTVTDPLSNKRMDTPVAPPAFPSIPLGMALQRNQISEAEVQTVLRGEPDDLPEPPVLPAPPKLPPPAPAPQRGARTGLLLVGVAVVLGLLLGMFTLAAVLVLAALFLTF